MYLKILKMDPTTLFTHLKIILLQCFQFLVSVTISSIQTDPKYAKETGMNSKKEVEAKWLEQRNFLNRL